jgi:hypothetical protein
MIQQVRYLIFFRNHLSIHFFAFSTKKLRNTRDDREIKFYFTLQLLRYFYFPQSRNPFPPLHLIKRITAILTPTEIFIEHFFRSCFRKNIGTENLSYAGKRCRYQCSQRRLLTRKRWSRWTRLCLHCLRHICHIQQKTQ